MDQSTSAESQRVAILSNVVLSPQEHTSHNGDVMKSEIIDITHHEIKHEKHDSSASSSYNILFDLLTKQGLAEKRKQHFSVGEGSARKRAKTEKAVNLDSEDCDGDEEDPVFNYLTGTYENAGKSVESRVHEDLSVEVHSHQDGESSNTGISLDAPEEHSVLEQDNPSHDDVGSSNAIVSLNTSNENLLLESPSTSNNKGISLNTNKENDITSGTIHIDSISKPNGNIQTKNHIDSSLKSTNPVLTESTSDPVEKRVANKIHSLELNTPNWNCKTCGHNARTKQELISHVYNAHLKEDYEIKIKCKICNFECDTQSEIEKHELSHERNTTSSTSRAVPISQSSAAVVRLPLHDIIPNSFDESLERGSQTRGTEISQNSRDVLETSDSDDALPSDTKGKHVQCCLCNYKTNKVSKLRRHARRHSGLKYYCDDHFWIGALTTCPKCIFEKLMLNPPKYVSTCKIPLQVVSDVSHVASLENTDQNKSGCIENQSSQCSVQPAHNSVINVEPSSNIETSLKNVSSFVQNVTSSVQKDNMSNENTSKKRKIFEISSDSSPEKDFPVLFKCFDCDKAIFKKDELRTHALSFHPESSFTCDQHESKTRFYECQKCVYQLIFKNCQVTRSGCDDACDEDSSQVVRISNQIRTGVDAFDVDYHQVQKLRDGTSKGRDTGKYVQKQFKYKEPTFSNKCDTDTDSDRSVDADSTEVRVTRARASKNRSLMKQSESKLTSKAVDKNSIGTASTDYLSSTELGNAKPPTNSEIRIAAKCFDCEYTNVCGLYSLKSHACRHLGSKYQCIEHWKLKLKDCLKCLYEEILQNLHKEVIICSTCAYKTNSKYKMDRHWSIKLACDKWQKRTLPREELMCFECEYITTSKDLLKYHMVDHLDREFCCEKHPDNKEGKCLRCIHKECLENARKEALSCEECGFKTVNKQVFKIHGCAVRMDDESTNEVVSEGTCNRIITQESVEVEIDTTAKKYSCFDCDEFATDTMDDLKQHANLHSSSNFQCNEHISDTIEECSKCIYQKVVKSLKNSAGKSTDVSNNKILTLTSHDISLVDAENTEPSSESDSENNPNSDDLLHNERSPQNNSGDVSNQQVGPSQAKCFDCNKYFSDKGYTFRRHVSRHFGTKYQCLEHWQNKVIDCSKCYYEHVLQNLYMNLKVCKTCGYKTVDSSHLVRHLSSAQSCKKSQFRRKLLSSEVICFGCQYITTNETFLKYHMVDHLERNFSCKKHRTKKERPCEGCINEKCLERAKKEALTCKKCGFKTIIKKVFELHECIPSSAVKSKCILMDKNVDGELDNSKKTLERISIEAGNTAPNPKTDTPHIGHSTDNKKISDKQTAIIAKCFDCKSFNSCKGFDFLKHVCRHIGSKYQCMEHWKDKLENRCLKCHYECALKNLNKQVRICETCRYRTIEKSKMDQHCASKDSCERRLNRKVLPGEIRCLECYYVTTRKIFLKYHMVDHLDLKFSCDVHCENKTKECEKCINEECLENAKKEAKICEKCKFKTVIPQIFQRHECTAKSGGGTTKGTSNEVGAPEEQDSEVITIEDVEVGIEATAKTYTCFDCKEFTTDTMDGLRKHANLHSRSEFQCDEHCTGPATEDCPKCIYQKLVNKSETHNYGYSLKTIDLSLAESENDASSTSKNNNKTTENQQESQDGSKNNENKKTDVKTKCFDCKDSFAGEECDFKTHVSRHMGSKYQCVEHWKNKVKHCSKCHYEAVLKNLGKDVKSCKTCGFKAFDEISLTRHIEGLDTCKEWACRILGPGEIRCLGCHYVTARKAFLKCHMVDHLDLKFSCDMHRDNKNEKCEKCINEECLESAKKVALICEKCKFKTVIKQIFEIHECKAKMAVKSTGSTKQDVCNPEEQNSDVINIEKYSEEVTDKISGKFRCFDCDEFTTDTADELKSHAIRHYKTTFQCTEHCSNAAVEDCSKCIYQNVVKSLENRVFVCEKCQFKTNSEDAFSNHDCDMGNDKDGSRTNFEKEGQDNACNVALASGRDSSELLEPSLNVFKCFDCGVTKRTILGLKNHAVLHLGSTFRCEAHKAQTDINCHTCVYEDIVKNIGNNTFTCKNCGFETYSWFYLSKHEQSNADCRLLKAKLLADGKSLERVQVKAFRCFDCSFSHERRDFLEKHVSVHIRSTFQCENHKEYLEGCQQCLYRSLLDQVRSRYLVKCFDCDPPKTVTSYSSIKRHIMKIHKDSSYFCRRHNQRTEHCSRCTYEYMVMQVNKNVYRIVCCDCKDEKFASKKSLKDHIKKFHLRSSFGCNLHPLSKEPDVCHMCLYEESVQLCESEANSVEIVASRSKQGLSHYQCFDCDFKTPGRDAIATHVCNKHLGSNFSCQKHTLGDIDESTCSMCRYEHVLVTAKQDVVFRCSICNFEALNKDALSKHHKQKHTEASSMNIARVSENFGKKLTRFPCFDCGYFVTNSQENLIKHMSRATHRSSTFKYTCKKHKLFDDACERCVFAEVSKKVKKRKKTLKKR